MQVTVARRDKAFLRFYGAWLAALATHGWWRTSRVRFGRRLSMRPGVGGKKIIDECRRAEGRAAIGEPRDALKLGFDGCRVVDLGKGSRHFGGFVRVHRHGA